MAMSTRRISEKEVKQINKIIRPRFGAKLQIMGGTCETTCGTAYHLVVGDPTNTHSMENLQRIGKILKEEWDSTAEYYSYGKKIS